jgi:hypothetical protein
MRDRLFLAASGVNEQQQARFTSALRPAPVADVAHGSATIGPTSG